MCRIASQTVVASCTRSPGKLKITYVYFIVQDVFVIIVFILDVLLSVLSASGELCQQLINESIKLFTS